MDQMLGSIVLTWSAPWWTAQLIAWCICHHDASCFLVAACSVFISIQDDIKLLFRCYFCTISKINCSTQDSLELSVVFLFKPIVEFQLMPVWTGFDQCSCLFEKFLLHVTVSLPMFLELFNVEHHRWLHIIFFLFPTILKMQTLI